MKGIILLGLERYVAARYGHAELDAILVEAQPQLSTSDPILGVATYPDSDASGLVRVACRRLGVMPGDFLREVGRFCFPMLAARYSQTVAGHATFRAFLGHLERAIHVEVDKVLEGARTPRFHFTWRDDDRVRVEYRSDRGLCALALGLLEGGAAYFGSRIVLEEEACTHRGDDHCAWGGAVS